MGFVKLWSAVGSFQPFITNDTVEPPTETLISRGNSTRLSVNYVKLKRASLSVRSYAVGRFSKLENAPSSSSLSSMRVTGAAGVPSGTSKMNRLKIGEARWRERGGERGNM